MTTVELIRKISDSNNITTGRAEMIISIIFERLTEKLRKEGEVSVFDLGNFKIVSKRPSSGSSLETNIFVKNYVVFQPSRIFLDVVNS